MESSCSIVMRLGSRSTPPEARLTTTSSDWKRNSFGSLTAWLLPCWNTLAVFMRYALGPGNRYVQYTLGAGMDEGKLG